MTAPRWWFCRTCEAANNATACVCEVCESAAPAVLAAKVSWRDPLAHPVVVASRVETSPLPLHAVARPRRWYQTPWIEACVAPFRRAYIWCVDALRELDRDLR